MTPDLCAIKEEGDPPAASAGDVSRAQPWALTQGNRPWEWTPTRGGPGPTRHVKPGKDASFLSKTPAW